MDHLRALVTGAAGMLGTALLDLCPAGVEATGIDLADGDITDADVARRLVVAAAPDVVIHCAAFTNVDGCTRDPETAYRVNAVGTGNVAAACNVCGGHLIALSTDYVFDGTKCGPYDELDEPNPLNPYGESKLAGERLAVQCHDRVLIARTQWLYGPGGRNFVHTIVTRGRELGRVRVVADEWGAPTYTRDLAARLWELAQRRPTGILHCANSGVCSWADLACHALEASGAGHVEVERISQADWDSPTRRPQRTPLVSRRETELHIRPLRPWQEAVSEYAVSYLR